MIRCVQRVVVLALALLVTACGTTDSAMRDQGHSEAYVQGFHDGRHSGMKEAGNNWEHYIRDHERFSSDREYQAGWVAGEIEGKHLQAQAQAVGDAAAGSYTGYRVGQEVDKTKPDPNKALKEATKGVDTSGLNSLGE